MTAAGTEPKLLLISPICATNYKISAGWNDYPLLGTIHPALAQIFYLTIFSSAQIRDINEISIRPSLGEGDLTCLSVLLLILSGGEELCSIESG